MPTPANLTLAEPQVSSYRMKHIPELDGIRGIAAIVVFFHHISYSTLYLKGQPGWPSSILWLFQVSKFGDRGVDLFFVLSGFLITSILIQDRRSTRYYQDFYWKRGLRILPLYIVILILVAVTMHQPGYILLSAFFLVNFAPVLHVIGFGPFWSLAIEEQFYLIWPTVVRRRSVSQIRFWAIALGLMAIVLRFLSARHGHFNYYITLLRCDGLAFGAVLACHFNLAGGRQKSRQSLDVVWVGILALGAGMLLFLRLHLSDAIFADVVQTNTVLITGSLVGLIISRTGAAVMAPLRKGVLPFFGLISYALYMIHLYLIVAYDYFRGTLAAGDVRGYWLRMGIVFALTIILSLVSRYLIELPAMGLRRFVLKHPKPDQEPNQPPIPLGQM